MPLVSLLLPVRNGAPHLAAALRSLSRQTFEDFEIVAVDDGSTDRTPEILDRARRAERRLVVAHLPARGLPAALEAARALARSPLLARQDADDVSHRERLERQLAYLAAHPQVDVVGTRVRLFPTGDFGAGMKRWAAWHNALLGHDEMARELLIDSPLAHGTAMLRATALERAGGWQDPEWAEDVDLWRRLIAGGARLAKLPATLYAWRQHEASATRRDPRYAAERFDAFRLRALEDGLLAASRSVTVTGVGRSLERWDRILRGTGRRVRAVEARGVLPAFESPAVLVFGAHAAREKRRAALAERGLVEGTDFAFVA